MGERRPQQSDGTLDAEITLTRPNTLVERIVLADGIGSSGKGMLSHILASFSRIEKQRNDTVFDTIPLLYMLNKISRDAAVAIMNTEADMYLYQTMISREVNFRPGDSTGVFNNPRFLSYLGRLFMKEGDPVIDRIRKARPIFQNAPHDALRNSLILFAAFEERLQFVYMVRHPIEIIYDWYTRGFGERIGVDPREFQLSYEWHGEAVPLYALGWEQAYMEAGLVERCVAMVHHHFEANMGAYDVLPPEWQARVMLISFDALVTRPWSIVRPMANFLGTRPTAWTWATLRRERCPRNLDQRGRDDKERFIRSRISNPAFQEKFDGLLHAYNTLMAERFENAGCHVTQGVGS